MKKKGKKTPIRTWFYPLYQIGSPLFFSESKGISRFVVIEGESAFYANHKAARLGMHTGVDGIGDSWYSVSTKDGHETPSILGFEIDLYASFDTTLPTTKLMDGPEGYVHFIGGEVIEFWI